MQTLQKSTNNLVEVRRRWLKEALEAQRRVSELPEEIRELPGDANVDLNNKFTLSLYGGRETAEICALHGAVFGKPEISAYSGQFQIKGILGLDTSITVYEMPVPPNCQVVRIEYMASKFEAVCKDEE